MKTLANYSVEELEHELKRRMKEAVRIPELEPKPKIKELQEFIVESLKQSIKQEYFDDDMDNYIYEKTMETFFGEDYWTWYNNLPWM